MVKTKQKKPPNSGKIHLKAAETGRRAFGMATSSSSTDKMPALESIKVTMSELSLKERPASTSDLYREEIQKPCVYGSQVCILDGSRGIHLTIH